jgi:hypothetical protein
VERPLPMRPVDPICFYQFPRPWWWFLLNPLGLAPARPGDPFLSETWQIF